MSFSDDVGAFAAKADARNKALFVNVASAVKGSIVDGSPVTGAPGQPVDTGTLKASWILAFDAPGVAVISTNVEYAPIIEDNIRGAQLRSQVGGFHSVKMTVAGFERLVESELAKLA